MPEKKQHFEARWNHLHRLWQNAMAVESLPQFDRWVSEEFKKNSKFGSKDRKWYSEMLFSGVRFGLFVLFCSQSFEQVQKKQGTLKSGAEAQAAVNAILPQALAQFKKQIFDEKTLLIAWKKIRPEEFFYWIRLRYVAEKPEATDVLPLTEHLPGAGFFFEALQNHLRASLQIEDQLLFASIPLSYADNLQKRVEKSSWTAAQVSEFIKNQNTRPPLWLRMNYQDKTPQVFTELEKEDFVLRAFENALIATGAKGIFATESYRTGLFEIQDLASQKIGAAVACHPGQLVWDCCAGGGGKTLQIASRLQNKGAVYASDVREYKLEEVKKRARRAGFFNIRCLPWGGTGLPEFQKEVQNRNGFDWVLVDAPCSSSGTWRRNPDAKYRIEQSNLENLAILQLQLLTQSSAAVRPNGRLVYSTCSWIVSEDEKIVESFLTTHPQFKLESQTLYGNPFDDADTMFAAVLVRVG